MLQLSDGTIEPANIGKLVKEAMSDPNLIDIWWIIQWPGDCIFTPSSTRGMGHVVVTCGDAVQIALNLGTYDQAARHAISTRARCCEHRCHYCSHHILYRRIRR